MRQRVRLRDDTGSLVDREAERKLLAKYASKLFRGSERQPDLPELLPLSEEIFSAQAWSDAISKIPGSKSVPSFSPQTSEWKNNLDTVRSRLEHISFCSDCMAAKTGQIAIEAGKPQDDRPYACRPEGSTAYHKDHIKPEVLTQLAAYPQYAYGSGSSTHDAILRASSHCAVARSTLEACSNDLTSKLLGADKTELVGGIMASLDLAKAFDSLPHREIYLSLQEVNVPEPLCRLILHIHSRTQCAIVHESEREVVCMQMGLRQGCPVAPIVFAAWSARVCRIIDDG